ncbi:LOG family protein [Candidatus Kaiserbacteria bacterium]|nr:LOG family protein [Candidatus Kaiserbacteria bacterium]
MPNDQVQRAHDEAFAQDFPHVAHPRDHTPANKFGHARHSHEKVKVCVSGAAETGHCGIDAYEIGKEIGRQVVRQGAVLITGATTGFPLYAAVGAKEEGGFSIGFSPAASEREHVETFRLPLDYMDVVVYTGFGFPGRDLLMTRSADAVAVGCGRVGTIHEFTIAYEDKKPVGILEGAWQTDEVIKYIMKESNRPMSNVVTDTDPRALIERLIEMAQENKRTAASVYKSYDAGWIGNDRNNMH